MFQAEWDCKVRISSALLVTSIQELELYMSQKKWRWLPMWHRQRSSNAKIMNTMFWYLYWRDATTTYLFCLELMRYVLSKNIFPIIKTISYKHPSLKIFCYAGMNIFFFLKELPIYGICLGRYYIRRRDQFSSAYTNKKIWQSFD